MTDAELDEIERLANEATPGPWCVSPWDYGSILLNYSKELESSVARYEHPTEVDATRADCVFMSKAREDVPRLIAEVRRLQAALEDEYMKALKR